MKQRIIIEDLSFKTTIGVYDWEQAILQSLIVNVELECDMSPVFLSNDIHDTINYKTVCDDIQSVCHNEKAKLLETLAFKILQKLFSNYPCSFIKLSLKKPDAIKETAGVGVLIEVTKQEFENLMANN